MREKKKGRVRWRTNEEKGDLNRQQTSWSDVEGLGEVLLGLEQVVLPEVSQAPSK